MRVRFLAGQRSRQGTHHEFALGEDVGELLALFARNLGTGSGGGHLFWLARLRALGRRLNPRNLGARAERNVAGRVAPPLCCQLGPCQTALRRTLLPDVGILFGGGRNGVPLSGANGVSDAVGKARRCPAGRARLYDAGEYIGIRGAPGGGRAVIATAFEPCQSRESSRRSTVRSKAMSLVEIVAQASGAFGPIHLPISCSSCIRSRKCATCSRRSSWLIGIMLDPFNCANMRIAFSSTNPTKRASVGFVPHALLAWCRIAFVGWGL